MIQLPTIYLGPLRIDSIPTPDGWVIRAIQEYEITIDVPSFYWGA